MTEPDEKIKPAAVPTRTPKKKTPGIFDNLRTLPQLHPVEEILGLTDNPAPTPSTGSRGSTPSTPPTPARGSTPSRPSTPSGKSPAKQTVAPERDYTRFANSIVRSAVPTGIFGEQGGKSKELYDTLYSLTRGAIVPTRTIRISKDKLMHKAGIGSEVTLRKNLVRLRDAKLIKESIVPGAHGGNEYEVFLPEEIDATPSTPSRPSNPLYPLSNREGLEALGSRGSRGGLNQTQTTSSSEDKTFFKDLSTKTDDEAAPPSLTRALKSLIEKMTGREATQAELEKLVEVIEVIKMEGQIASARTTVSSAGPFLAEHLRRRLFKKNKEELAVESNESEPVQPALDASKCPDCGGAGWYYPEGKEKGIAKCKHLRLFESPPDDSGATLDTT